MKDVYSYKSFDLAVKDIDEKQGIVTGYFAHFNSKDSDGDIIKPGAFLKTIQENGPASAKPRIKHLLNHDVSKPLGKLTDLKEDTTGLYYESQVGTHSLGQDFIKMIESGLISEHSIGFKTIKEDSQKDANYMTELKLWEGSSLSGWGANMNTPLTGLKSIEKADIASKRIDLLVKALRSGTFTDDTFELIEIELKQLQQLFIDLTKTTVPEATTQPDNDLKAEDVMDQIKQILKF